MKVSTEDQRTAVGITVTLSSQLMAAALAMLAVEGALVTYALGERIPIRGFTLCCIMAGLSFILSIFIGGKGITDARDSGYEGKWSLDAGKARFNWQAFTSVVGLILLGVCLALSGETRESRTTQAVEELSERLEKVERDLLGESKRLEDLISERVKATHELKVDEKESPQPDADVAE